MPEYEYKGLPLTPTVAREHILECLHQHSIPVRRRDIVKYVEQQHQTHGGELGRDAVGSVSPLRTDSLPFVSKIYWPENADDATMDAP